MKITLPGPELAGAIGWAAALTPAKPPVPVLAALRLVATDTRLTVSAFDFDTAGTVTVTDEEQGLEVAEPGTVALSGRLLAAVAKTVAREKAVTLAVDGDRAVVSCGKAARWELPLLDGQDYPTLPTSGPTVASLDGGELVTALGRVLPVIAGDVATNLAGVAVSATEDGPVILAATDKYRLAVAEVGWTAPLGEHSLARVPEVMVPPALLRAAEDAIGTGGGEVGLQLDGHTVGLSGPRHTVVGRQLAERAPRWRVMLEGKGFVPAATLRVDELREALDRAVVVADPDANAALRLDGDGLAVSVLGAARGSAEHHAACRDWSGTEHRFGADPRYLRIMLDGLRSPLVGLQIGSSAVKAVPLDEQGQPTPGYTHVVALYRAVGEQVAA